MPRERKALTKNSIAKAKPGDVLWDHRIIGFGLRARKRRKVFFFRYRPQPGGRSVIPRVLKLGTYPALSLDDARALARVAAGQVAAGTDPQQQRVEERRRQRAVLHQLVAPNGPYQQHLEKRGLVNVRTAMHALQRGLRAHMSSDVKDLTRADVVGAINALTPGSAADLRKFARGFLEWTTAQGLTEFNVIAGLRSPSHTRQQRLLLEQKGKALTDGEIVAVWRAAQALQDRAACGEAFSGAFGGLTQLVILSGMRRSEVAQLEHRHIRRDEVRGISGPRLHLPRTITKSGADHDVPLTETMRQIINRQPKTTSPLIFPSRRTGRRLKNWADPVAGLQRDSRVDFRLHDLRRTFRTILSRLGIPEDISELALGHRRADLIARYNKDEAWAQRVEAFEAVSRLVSALLVEASDECNNVVALRHSDR
jgi:integrase